MRGSAFFSHDVPVNVCCVCSQERDACSVKRVVRCVVLGIFGWVRWLGWRQSASDDASLIVVLNARIADRIGAGARCSAMESLRDAVKLIGAAGVGVVGNQWMFLCPVWVPVV